jgi:hypothetical protein
VNKRRGGRSRILPPSSSLVRIVLDRYEADLRQADEANRGKFALIVGVVMRTGTRDGIPYIDICDGSLRETGMRAEFRMSEKMKVAELKPGTWKLLPDFQGQYRPALADADVVCIAGEFAGFTRVQPFVNCVSLKECFVVTPEFQKTAKGF